jgi:hypothetical protein
MPKEVTPSDSACLVMNTDGDVLAIPPVFESASSYSGSSYVGGYSSIAYSVDPTFVIATPREWFDVRMQVATPDTLLLPISRFRRGDYTINYVIDATPILTSAWQEYEPTVLPALARRCHLDGMLHLPGVIVEADPATSMISVVDSVATYAFRDLSEGFDSKQPISDWEPASWGDGFEARIRVRYEVDPAPMIRAIPTLVTAVGLMLSVIPLIPRRGGTNET